MIPYNLMLLLKIICNYRQKNDPVHVRCRQRHIKDTNKWKKKGSSVNVIRQDDSNESAKDEVEIDSVSDVEEEPDNEEEMDLPINPCDICLYKSYIEGNPNDPIQNPTIMLGKKGVENCNAWAKSRNMNISFKVGSYLSVLIIFNRNILIELAPKVVSTHKCVLYCKLNQIHQRSLFYLIGKEFYLIKLLNYQSKQTSVLDWY